MQLQSHDACRKRPSHHSKPTILRITPSTRSGARVSAPINANRAAATHADSSLERRIFQRSQLGMRRCCRHNRPTFISASRLRRTASSPPCPRAEVRRRVRHTRPDSSSPHSDLPVQLTICDRAPRLGGAFVTGGFSPATSERMGPVRACRLRDNTATP